MNLKSEIQNPKSEAASAQTDERATRPGFFGLRASGLSRVSSFGLRSFALLSILFVSYPARACSVCFGNSDSKLTQGMLAGVLVLLLVVLSVLGGFVALFVHLARRAAAAAALENQATESKVNP